MQLSTRFALGRLTLAAVGVGPIVAGCRSGPGEERPLLTWVATAQQVGVVGYRDPVGAIAPDGRCVAYSEGVNVRVVAIGGGVCTTLPAGDGPVRLLEWGAGGPEKLVAAYAAPPVRWWLLDPVAGSREPLFGGRATLEGIDAVTRAPVEVTVDSLHNITPSPDHRWLGATTNGPEGGATWRIAADGTRAERRLVAGRPSAVAWTPDGKLVGVVERDGRLRFMTADGAARVLCPDVDVVGPVAFCPDGSRVYFASPNGRGTVDLWSADWANGQVRRLTSFDRDTYAPSVARDGTVLFQTQSFRSAVAEIELASGRQRQLAAFQSETPSYDPSGRRVGLTFGNWRRLLDDARYPDISQDLGIVAAGPGAGAADAPIEVVVNSDSEDQSMAWSPNGRWIAYHSHREGSDDIWLRPADGSSPDRRISFVGPDAEVGWPRWSPDGTRVLFDGSDDPEGRPKLFVVGIDQDSGAVTEAPRALVIDGFDGDVMQGDWVGADKVVAIAREAPGRHVIFTALASGGRARIVRRFACEHDYPGLAVSPDGREVAFVTRAADGFFQIFRLALTPGAEPVQVTTDPTHKTQPAWSPDGSKMAFTVWSYQAQFWTIAP